MTKNIKKQIELKKERNLQQKNKTKQNKIKKKKPKREEIKYFKVG